MIRQRFQAASEAKGHRLSCWYCLPSNPREDGVLLWSVEYVGTLQTVIPLAWAVGTGML
jgi:hypothetical protein